MPHQKNISCILEDAQIAAKIANDISPEWFRKFEEIDTEADEVDYLSELASTSPTAWHSGYLCMLISIKLQTPAGLAGAARLAGAVVHVNH